MHEIRNRIDYRSELSTPISSKKQVYTNCSNVGPYKIRICNCKAANATEEHDKCAWNSRSKRHLA